MKSFVIRLFALMAMALALAACQSTASNPPASSGFETELAAGRLESAQLALGSEQEDAAQLAERRQRLADAYLERSRAALAKGDVNGATTALTRARSLMPRAPGVAADVSGLQKPDIPAPAAQPNCTP
ncbi:hypothetical protein ACQCLI_27785 [Pseudomonas nitroreducens]|uniref:hypothetical protein n=1 Tax=Pseudomonas TaxID=286 RepID=UPI0002ED3C60|nr:hypothetical protein [Pseudomonas nitroreducens]